MASYFFCLSILYNIKPEKNSFPSTERINWPKQPHNIHAAKGHLQQERKSLQSIKIPESSDIFPPSDISNLKTFNVFVIVDSFCHSSKAA